MRIIALLLLLLSGCATMTPEQQAAYRERQEEQRQAQREAYLEGLANQCEAFGYNRNQPDFRQCMMQLHQTNLNNEAAANSALVGAAIQAKINAARQPTSTLCRRTVLGVQCDSQ